MIAYLRFFGTLSAENKIALIKMIMIMTVAAIVELLGIIMLSDSVFSVRSSNGIELLVSIMIIIFASALQIYLTVIALQKVSYMGLMIPKVALLSDRYRGEVGRNRYSISEEIIGEAQRACDYVLLPLTMGFARLPLVLVVVLYAIWTVPHLIGYGIILSILSTIGLYYLAKTIGVKANRLSSKGGRARARYAEMIGGQEQGKANQSQKVMKAFDLGVLAYSHGRALTTGNSLAIRPVIELCFLATLGIMTILSAGSESLTSSMALSLGVGAIKILPNVTNIITGVLVAEANKSSLIKLVNAASSVK